MKSKLTTTAGVARPPACRRRCDRNNPNSYRHIAENADSSQHATTNHINIISSSSTSPSSLLIITVGAEWWMYRTGKGGPQIRHKRYTRWRVDWNYRSKHWRRMKKRRWHCRSGPWRKIVNGWHCWNGHLRS